MYEHTVIAYPNKPYTFRSMAKKTDSAINCGFGTACCITQYINANKKLYSSDNLIIFDIGANVGTTSIILSCEFPNATIYAFEPHPENYKCLLENISAYSRQDKILPYNIGFSGENKPMSMIKTIQEGNSGHYSTIPLIKHDNYIDVNMTTLNDFISSNNIAKIDILKIDCEGAEYDILYNLNYYDIIKSFHIEFHPHTISQEKLNYLKELNIFDIELGPSIAFKRWLYKKLNINFETKNTRIITD